MRKAPKSRASPGGTAPRGSARATEPGTRGYADRFSGQYAPDFYRQTRGTLTVSSIAVGTYLGDSDGATDELYAAACRHALMSGVNVIDTAINYRCQRSERVVGRVLKELMSEGAVQRDEVVVCTKAGYIPLDGAPPESREAYLEYLRREYFDKGLLRQEDVVGGGHSIAPSFLEEQLQRSLTNLGVQGIDVFYVHNPEQQLNSVSTAELMKRIRAAFSSLEGCVQLGKIGAYGCATWSGLRLPAGSQGHLSLYDLAGVAESIAGKYHHFRTIQLPVNLTMSEAVRVSTQRDRKGKLVNVLEAANDLGIDVVVSAPLLQGQLTKELPDQVRELFAGATDAQRALTFARGLPGVVSVAVGSRQVEHVRQNLSAFRAG